MLQPRWNERGFSLMEAIIATIITVIAVMGMAYSFGLGRSWIDRFELARVADGVAQAQMERLGTLAPGATDLTIGPHPAIPPPFTYNGITYGNLHWLVQAPDVSIPARATLRQVTVTVAWTRAGLKDSLSYQRLFPAP